MSFSSFGALRLIPVPVLPRPDDCSVYFISTGSIDGNLCPLEFQDEEREKQSKISMILFAASRVLAKEKGISPEDGRDLLFGRNADGSTSTVAINPIDYMSYEEGQDYLRLAGDAATAKMGMVTRLLRHRVAFELVVSQPCKAKSKQLFIQAPWYLEKKAIQVGQCFKFGAFSVQVTEPYDPDSESIGVTALAGSLEAGAVGFLLKSDNKTYAMGDTTWTDEETRSLSLVNSDGSESQIDLIYNFYLKEAGRLAEPEKKEESALPSKKKSKGFESPETQNQLTGTDSSGASSPTASTMNVSALPILETALVG